MGNELSFVDSTQTGCQIYRNVTGAYVVRHDLQPGQRALTPTLAGAYAACNSWERQQSTDPP